MRNSYSKKWAQKRAGAIRAAAFVANRSGTKPYGPELRAGWSIDASRDRFGGPNRPRLGCLFESGPFGGSSIAGGRSRLCPDAAGTLSRRSFLAGHCCALADPIGFPRGGRGALICGGDRGRAAFALEGGKWEARGAWASRSRPPRTESIDRMMERRKRHTTGPALYSS